MSKIGKKPVLIPEKVNIEIDKNCVTVKGPLGSLKEEFKDVIKIEIADNKILVQPVQKEDMTKEVNEYWGLARRSILNLVEGVTKGFEKRLMIEGVGYKGLLQGKKLVLSLGYSHPVEIEIPDDIKVEVKDNVNITIKGMNRYKVGQLAAMIRNTRVPDPYKAKGVRYINEVIKRKVGKTGV
ncbi:MAG: 50S ribosomal protein L6 [bacterium]|nr:50S ribosomal protein L6 [bacterium]